jgi:hypothetical protein
MVRDYRQPGRHDPRIIRPRARDPGVDPITVNALEFAQQVAREKTGKAIEIAAVIGRAMTGETNADCWTAIAAATTAMARDLRNSDRDAALLGFMMIVEDMLGVGQPPC